MASYLNTLNQIVYTNPSIVTSSDSDDAIRYNSLRVKQDINNVADYINQVIVQSYRSLASKPLYPFDVIESGMSGLTIITYPEEEGNNRFNTEMFWKQGVNEEVGRPCTIKESFDYILGQLVERVVEIRQTVPDITDLEESLACVINNQMRLKRDTFGEKYILNCLDQKNNQFSLAKHIYEFVTQLANGDDYPEIFGELDTAATNYPELFIEYSRINNRVQSIFDLIDVDLNIEKNQTHPSEGQILRWTWGLEGNGDPEGDGGDGYFAVVDMPEIPSSLNDLTDVNVDGVAAGETIVWNGSNWSNGSLEPSNRELFFGSSAELENSANDVEQIKDIFEIDVPAGAGVTDIISYGEENGITFSEEVLAALQRFLAHKKKGNGFYFDNNKSKWVNSFGGNVSNFNEVTFFPEIYTNDSNYIVSLSEEEKEIICLGGLNKIPFVFCSAFRIESKLLLDENFWKASNNTSLLDYVGKNLVSTYPGLTFTFGEINKNALVSNALGAEFNNNEDSLNSFDLGFKNSMPIATTRTSTIYLNEFQEKELEYKPNHLLGVIRSDSEDYATPTSRIGKKFLYNETGLSGEVDPVFENFIIEAYSGISCQHSGYSRVMVVGPYKIGDKIFLCPQQILESVGIMYPYGICISESFLLTPIKDLLILTNETAFNASLPTLVSEATLTFYELLKESTHGFSAVTGLTENLFKKILSNPVGMITKNDSPRYGYRVSPNVNEVSNIAHKICAKLLKETYKGTKAFGFNDAKNRLLNYFSSISLEEKNVWETQYVLGGKTIDKGSVLLYDWEMINLPLCKIELNSLNYEEEILDKEIPPAETPELTLDPTGDLTYGGIFVGNVYPIIPLVLTDRILYESGVIFYGSKYTLTPEDPPYVFKNNFLEEEGLLTAYLSEGMTSFKIFAGSIYLDFFEKNTYWDLQIRIRSIQKSTEVLGEDLVAPIIIEQNGAIVGTNSFSLQVPEQSINLNDDTDIAITFESSVGTPALTEIVTNLKLFMRIKFSN